MSQLKPNKMTFFSCLGCMLLIFLNAFAEAPNSMLSATPSSSTPTSKDSSATKTATITPKQIVDAVDYWKSKYDEYLVGNDALFPDALKYKKALLAHNDYSKEILQSFSARNTITQLTGVDLVSPVKSYLDKSCPIYNLGEALQRAYQYTIYPLNVSFRDNTQTNLNGCMAPLAPMFKTHKSGSQLQALGSLLQSLEALKLRFKSCAYTGSNDKCNVPALVLSVSMLPETNAPGLTILSQTPVLPYPLWFYTIFSIPFPRGLENSGVQIDPVDIKKMYTFMHTLKKGFTWNNYLRTNAALALSNSQWGGATSKSELYEDMYQTGKNAVDTLYPLAHKYYIKLITNYLLAHKDKFGNASDLNTDSLFSKKGYVDKSVDDKNVKKLIMTIMSASSVKGALLPNEPFTTNSDDNNKNKVIVNGSILDFATFNKFDPSGYKSYTKSLTENRLNFYEDKAKYDADIRGQIALQSVAMGNILKIYSKHVRKENESIPDADWRLHSDWVTKIKDTKYDSDLHRQMLYLLAEMKSSVVENTHLLERILTTVSVQSLLNNADSSKSSELTDIENKINQQFKDLASPQDKSTSGDTAATSQPTSE
jgi:hypothetical protein